jgi:hypothetical protein
MNSQLTHITLGREWLTAKIADPCLVRRCLGRLDAKGFEYLVVCEDRQLRVLVRRARLDDAIELLADLSYGAYHGHCARQSGQYVRLLAAIPIGAAIGSALSAVFDVPVQNGTTISATCACLAAFTAALCQPTWPRCRRIFTNTDQADC